MLSTLLRSFVASALQSNANTEKVCWCMLKMNNEILLNTITVKWLRKVCLKYGMIINIIMQKFSSITIKQHSELFCDMAIRPFFIELPALYVLSSSCSTQVPPLVWRLQTFSCCWELVRCGKSSAAFFICPENVQTKYSSYFLKLMSENSSCQVDVNNSDSVEFKLSAICHKCNGATQNTCIFPKCCSQVLLLSQTNVYDTPMTFSYILVELNWTGPFLWRLQPGYSSTNTANSHCPVKSLNLSFIFEKQLNLIQTKMSLQICGYVVTWAVMLGILALYLKFMTYWPLHEPTWKLHISIHA